MACEVNVYTCDRKTGQAELIQRLCVLDPAETGKCLGAAIRLHPNGRWLYVSVRGSNQLAVLRIKEDGSLELIQRVNSGGKIPRDFLLSPNGKYLLAGHQDTDSICVFAIDPENGFLSPKQMVEDVFCVTGLALWQNSL